MDELFWVFLLVVAVVSIPLILLGLFFRTEKSHRFINGREKITNIQKYAENTGNSLILSGLIIVPITLVFSLHIIGPIMFAVLTCIASLLPLPFIIYTHIKYTESS